MGNSEKDIRKTCPKTVVGKGLSINGSQADRSDKQIEKWLKGNGLL